MVYRNQFLAVAFLLLAFAVPVLMIVWPYLQAIFLAGALTIVVGSFCRWLAKKIKSNGWAAFLTVLGVILIILAPLFLIGLAAFGEAKQLYLAVADGRINFSSWNGWLTGWQEKLNRLAPGADFNFNPNDLLAGGLNWLVGNFSSIFSEVASVLLLFLISLFVLFYFLKDGEALKKFLIGISPLKNDYTILLLERVKNSVNAVVRGSLIIALIQGVASALGFLIFGLPNPFLFAILAAVASLIPAVGTALVFVPAIIYAFLAGQPMAALGLLIWGFLLVGSIDNLIRPFLVRHGAQLHPAVVFLSVLGGLVIFGPLGFIIGPVIFSVFFALLDLYATFGRREID